MSRNDGKAMAIKPMAYCQRCVYPFAAVNLSIDNDGICSSCRTAEEFGKLPQDYWRKRKDAFERCVAEVRKRKQSDYDCIIPVSGGKDSYYQTHIVVSEYGLKPLLVTYHGNNYLPEGNYNRDRMREVFDAEELILIFDCLIPMKVYGAHVPNYIL